MNKKEKGTKRPSSFLIFVVFKDQVLKVPIIYDQGFSAQNN